MNPVRRPKAPERHFQLHPDIDIIGLAIGHFQLYAPTALKVYHGHDHRRLQRIGQVVPDPKTSMLPIVKEYREEIKKQGLKPNVFALESYITSSITFRAIKRVEGPLTMDKLIEQFEKMHNFDYKGIILNFNPKTRSLAHQYWINTGEGPWVEQLVKEGS